MNECKVCGFKGGLLAGSVALFTLDHCRFFDNAKIIKG